MMTVMVILMLKIRIAAVVINVPLALVVMLQPDVLLPGSVALRPVPAMLLNLVLVLMLIVRVILFNQILLFVQPARSVIPLPVPAKELVPV